MKYLRRNLTIIQQIFFAYLRRGLTLVLLGTAFAALMIFIVGLVFLGITPEFGLTLTSMLQMVVEASSYVALGLSILLGVALSWNVIGATLATVFDTSDFHLDQLQSLHETITLRMLVYNAVALPLILIALISLSGVNSFGVMCMGSMTIILGLVAGDMASNSWRDVLKRYIDKEKAHLYAEQVREFNKKKRSKREIESTDRLAESTEQDDETHHLLNEEEQQAARR